MHPPVSVVILNWNAKNYIKDCLDSVLKSDYKNFRAIFVDNASSDGSPEFVKRIYKKQVASGKLLLLLNKKNLGVPEGNNIGIAMALAKKSEYVALLNPDTIVDKKWISSLVTEAERNKKLGAVQGKMLCFDKKTIDSTGIVIYSSLMNCVDRGQGEKDRGQYDRQKELLAVCAAGALYRASAINDVKMGNDYLDEDFFCYWEDTDLSLRLILRGWKLAYCPGAVMYHGRSVLTGKSSPFSAYYLHRNNFWFVVKCIPAVTIIKKLPMLLAFNIVTFFGFLLFRQGCFTSFLRAKLDSLLGAGKMLKKRKMIMSRAKASRKEVERLIDKNFVSPSFFK